MIVRRAAVLGRPIEHSRSPVLHRAGYHALGLDAWDYKRFECGAAELPGLVSSAGDEYRGFSVTMPAKFAALEFADVATDRVRAIGAANTLVRTATGWLAENTDVTGITGCLHELLPSTSSIEHAVVIGSGGTARPAIWALREARAGRITVLNRSNRLEELAGLVEGTDVGLDYAGFDVDLEALAYGADVIISTVPSAAIDEHAPKLGHAPVIDVIYDPWPTRLTIAAAANGHPSVGGHVMLAHQAYEQFELFTGYPAPRAAMRAALFASLDIVDIPR